MISKGADFSTDFGKLKEAEAELPLARLQRDSFDTQASKEKKAIIFDGYDYRVTIESKAGDTNQMYSTVLDMLSNADIRYREVRRYTVEPDRVLLDILITKDDVDVIKAIDKEAKDYNISFTFNDNISEGVQPKTIVTPEKEVPEKVETPKETK